MAKYLSEFYERIMNNIQNKQCLSKVMQGKLKLCEQQQTTLLLCQI